MSSLSASLFNSGSASNAIDLSALLQVATGSSAEGINVKAAVSAAVTAARAPEQQWQSQQASIRAQQSDLRTVSSGVSTLENDLSALSSLSGVFSYLGVSSSDSSIASAFVSPDAVAGTHLIKVSSLATTASWYSSTSVAGSSTGLAAGSFTLQLGAGAATEITIEAGETLSELTDAINEQELGVTASIVNDASGSRLAIVSNSSGSANDIVITDNSPQWAQSGDGSSWNTGPVDDNAGLSCGSFTIRLGNATPVQITASAGESLGELASDINNRNLGVTASVVTDGDGFSHLAVVNNASGDANGVTISNISPQFTRATQGRNASLTVDGIPITSATNTVSGAVPGMTINLNGADPSAEVTISATANTGAIVAAINQFVNDYNKVIGYVNTEYTYTPGGSSPPLAGDSGLAFLQNFLLGTGGYRVNDNHGISTLGSLGISMNDDGSLSLNGATLNNAIQNNFSAVQKFFEGNSLNGFASALKSRLHTLTDSSTGAFTVELKHLQSSYDELADEIDNFEANYISSLQTRLTAEYNAAEIALQTLNTTRKQIEAQLDFHSSDN